MNTKIFIEVLKTLMEYVKNKDKNMAINFIEEYIEWFNYSKQRFGNDYIYYLTFLQIVQAEVLLDNYTMVLLNLNNMLENLTKERRGNKL